MEFLAVLYGSSLLLDYVEVPAGIEEQIGELFRFGYCDLEGVQEVCDDVWADIY